MSNPCESVRIKYKGNGTQKQFTFPFTYMHWYDVTVGLWDENRKAYVDQSNKFVFANATTIEMLEAPKAPTDPDVYNIIIGRNTDLTQMKATFYPGSSIRAEDLNDDFDQLRLAIQEGRCQIEAKLEQLQFDFWGKKSIRGRKDFLVAEDGLDTVYRKDQEEGFWSTDGEQDAVATTGAIAARHDVYVQDNLPTPPTIEQLGKQWMNTQENWASFWDDQTGTWIAYHNHGPRGAQGPAGLGPEGPVGPQGVPGPVGPQGPRGLQGLTGPQGTPGPAGPASTVPGPAGPTGPTGPTGATGATGPVGPAGPKGADSTVAGPVGPVGPVGPKGADSTVAGPQGIQGPTGVQGPQGVAGPQGIQGIQGTAGTSVKLLAPVADAASLPATGNTAGDGRLTLDNGHLHYWNGTAWQDNGLVRGPKGDQGAPGTPGVQGPAGAQGLAGVKGDQGDPTIINGTSPIAASTVGNTATISVSDATATTKGVVRLADAAAITAGTAGRVVDAAQLKAAAPADASTTVKGVVQLADAAAITAGTAGLVVDAAQLKAVSDADDWTRTGTTIAPRVAGDAVDIDFPLGTAALPGLTPVGDPNTGIYSPGADQLAISTGGIGRAHVAANGKVGIGVTAPTTAGGILQLNGGITFPATAVASSDPNTLDDYEEGTWTPSQGAGLTVVGAYSSAGVYRKIGDVIHVFAALKGATSIASSAGGVLCGGLPFTPVPPLSGWVVGSMMNHAQTQSNTCSAIGSTNVYGTEAVTANVGIYFAMTYRV